MNAIKIALAARAILQEVGEANNLLETPIVPGFVRVYPTGPATPDGLFRDYPTARSAPDGRFPFGVGALAYANWLTDGPNMRRADGTPYCTQAARASVFGANDSAQTQWRLAEDAKSVDDRDMHLAYAIDMLMHWHDYASQAELDRDANQAKADLENETRAR